MRPASLMSYAYLAYFSQPAAERVLYKQIARQSPASILELGMGEGRRTQRILAVALRRCAEVRIRYAAVDLFEGRAPEAPGLSLKEAHKLLTGAAVQVKLTPGDPCSGLMRIANTLQNMDLVLVSNDQDQEAMQRAWRYLPRMLHPASQVWVQTPGDGDAPWRPWTLDEVRRAADPRTRRAA